MKTISKTLLLATFILACNNNNNGGGGNTPQGGVPQHQALMTSLQNFNNSNNVANDFFAAVPGSPVPTYADPNMQAMATGIHNCTLTLDGKGGGSIAGANCPISFAQTLTANSIDVTYSVVDPSFQVYNPVQNFSLTVTDNSLGTNLGGTVTISATITTTDSGQVSYNATLVTTATDPSGEYTETVTMSISSSTDKTELGGVITAHRDAQGNPVIDSETCSMDGTPLNCTAVHSSKLQSRPKLAIPGRRH